MLRVAAPGATVAPMRPASLAAPPRRAAAAELPTMRHARRIPPRRRRVGAADPGAGRGDGRIQLHRRRRRPAVPAGLRRRHLQLRHRRGAPGRARRLPGRAGRRCQRPHAARAVGCRGRRPPRRAQRPGGLHRDLLRHATASAATSSASSARARPPAACGRPTCRARASRRRGCCTCRASRWPSPTAPATPPMRPSTSRARPAWPSASTPTCG